MPSEPETDPERTPAPSPRTPRVAIVGAGMSGICMAIKLKREGIDSFTIYEKADAVGGTWRENTYPGLTCDVPSGFYQYSFQLEPGWSHTFSPGGEIRRYFERVVDEYGLRPHIRFGEEVTEGRFEGGGWSITTRSGASVRADFLISACGVLHHPRVPEIEGLGSFRGACFHSARWRHDVDLRDKRVAVIGTGSTGVQIVTALAGEVERLLHFQRTAQWIFPVPNRRTGRLARALLHRFPGLRRLSYRSGKLAMDRLFSVAVVRPGWQRRLISALSRLHLRRVRDPELRRRLTPDYEPMCKRLVMSWDYYPAIQRTGVELITAPIERIEPDGIVTADGTLHELDAIVLATGFDAHAYLRPIELVGEGGITLEREWRDGPRAHRITALAGFPNFFMLIGPHSPVGNYSLIALAEQQADFALGWIRRWRAGEIETVAPKRAAMESYNAELREAMAPTVWATGCDSWYIGPDGSPDTWPWSIERHRNMLRDPDPDEYELVRPDAAGREPGPAAQSSERI